jgi:hypothetical protein
MKNGRLALAWISVAVLLLAACGGGDGGGSQQNPPAPNPPTPNTIGPAGGTVNGPNGSRVIIPAGALSQANAIAITASSAGAPSLPAGLPAVSQVFALTPHGTVFAIPVTVTLPFDPLAVPASASPSVRKTNAAQSGWEPVASPSITGNEISVQVTSFSWFYVASTPPPELTVQVSGRGTVTASGIACPADCTENYALNTVVTLQAVPASGWSFDRWASGCDSVVGDRCTVTLSQARNVSAVFVSVPNLQFILTVTRDGEGFGRVSGTGINCGLTCEEVYPGGTSITLTATPLQGMQFVEWTGCDAINADQCTVTMDEFRNVTAVFAFLPNTAEIFIARGGPGLEAAHIVSNPPGIDCTPQPCGVRFLIGESVQLTVTDGSPPAQSWTGCDSSAGNGCTVIMRGDESVQVTFNSPGVFGLRVHKPRAGAGTVRSANGEIDCGPDCHNSYPGGTTVTLIAEPSPGSQFTGWSGCDRLVDTTRCEIDVRVHHDVTALFD